MQPERQIGLACMALSSLIVIPEAIRIVRHVDALPGATLLVGGLLGALSICFGLLLARDQDKKTVRMGVETFWLLIAIALAAVMLFASWRNPQLWWKILFIAAGLLTLLVAGITFWRNRRLQE